MDVGNWIKRNVTSALESVLPQSIRLIRHYSGPSIDWSLRNAWKCGFQPAAIIDVGAYTGEWTKMAHRIFPEANILAIEPQKEKESGLLALAGEHSNIDYEVALLGAESGKEVTFRLNETVSSVLPEAESDSGEPEERTLQTLDELTYGAYRNPDLLKLDVQGFELEVLWGAEQILVSHPPELILMEVSLLEINEGAPLFSEVVRFMDNRGYRLYDICSFIRRPLDDALWQVDALFVEGSSKLISSKRWQSRR
jgi:FkbM family methyltransferase